MRFGVKQTAWPKDVPRMLISIRSALRLLKRWKQATLPRYSVASNQCMLVKWRNRPSQIRRSFSMIVLQLGHPIGINSGMPTKLTKELADPLNATGENELEVVEPSTQRTYFVVDVAVHRRAMDALRRQQNWEVDAILEAAKLATDCSHG